MITVQCAHRYYKNWQELLPGPVPIHLCLLAGTFICPIILAHTYIHTYLSLYACTHILAILLGRKCGLPHHTNLHFCSSY